MKSVENPYRFVSWGCGVQSTTLCVMSTMNLIPRVDAVITADTLWEHSYTYKIRDLYKNWLEEREIRVEIVNNGDIRIPTEHANLPLWTSKSGAPLRRQCTGEYKIVPIRRKIRELCGISQLNVGRTKRGLAVLYLGISYDEAERMRDSDRNYIINEYPLVDMKITRQDCIEFLKKCNLSVPMKSACVICPYQGAERWQYIKENYPDEFKQAVEYDKLIREPSISMSKRGHGDLKLYLWKKLKPLDDEDFTQYIKENDYNDICDSGYCFI
jgi:hypothetical protein